MKNKRNAAIRIWLQLEIPHWLVALFIATTQGPQTSSFWWAHFAISVAFFSIAASIYSITKK